MKKQLAWLTKEGITENIDSLLGPVSVTPRALVDKDGLPYKSSKSSTTEYLKKRYSNEKIVSSSLPSGWTPQTVIMEGMFFIQVTPLPSMTCMSEYVSFLIKRFLSVHIKAGVPYIHVVFDNPGSMPETPKELEQQRRDKGAQKDLSGHECIDVHNDLQIPTKWRQFLSCRRCKKQLTTYLAQELLRIVIRGEQQFYCNMGCDVFVTDVTGETTKCPHLWTNANEGDLMVWLHCIHSEGRRVLVVSMDTDVYHIGLTVAGLVPTSRYCSTQ